MSPSNFTSELFCAEPDLRNVSERHLPEMMDKGLSLTVTNAKCGDNNWCDIKSASTHWHTDTVFACKSDKQCGQMARLLFPYLAITNIQICSVTEHFCQSRLRIFTSSKWTFIKNCQMFKFLPKWQNFFKSGHTAFESVLFFREHNTRVGF